MIELGPECHPSHGMPQQVSSRLHATFHIAGTVSRTSEATRLFGPLLRSYYRPVANMTRLCTWGLRVQSSISLPVLKMFNMKSLLTLPTSLLLALPFLVQAQQACSTQYPLTYNVVHEQVISIKTDVLFNTTFKPARDITMTVENAPTSFDGLTTVWWTERRTQMSSTSFSSTTTSAIQTSATPTDPSFVLLVMGEKRNQKRQSGSYYVSANGTITNDCTTSPIYTISNGQLTAIVNGVVFTYSTSSGVAFAPFIPSTVPGTITTTFALGGGNQVLSWQNSAFFNGQASFCALSNGTVYAVFQQNSQPDGCLYIQLSLFSVSSCQGLSFSTITGRTYHIKGQNWFYNDRACLCLIPILL